MSSIWHIFLQLAQQLRTWSMGQGSTEGQLQPIRVSVRARNTNHPPHGRRR